MSDPPPRLGDVHRYNDSFNAIEVATPDGMRRVWLERCKPPIILLSMVCFVGSLQVVFGALAPVSNAIEASLIAAVQQDDTFRAALAAGSYHLWSVFKDGLLFPTIVIALTFGVEWWFSESVREPKDYVTAALVQAVFLSMAFAVAIITSKLIPLPDFELASVMAGDRSLSIVWSLGSILVYLIAFDFLLYWSHRVHHAVPMLWKFHAVHHSPADLDALHNFVHPAELFVRYFTIGIPLGLLIQIDQNQFYAVLAFLTIQNQLSHMNVPMNFGAAGAVLVDNRYHFIHHSRESRHFNRNFATIFTFNDRIFGTYQRPEPGLLPTTGFEAHERPVRIRDYLLARRTGSSGTW